MSALLPPRFEGAFHLPDGRELGYAEYGPSTGRPLVWFHGSGVALSPGRPLNRRPLWSWNARA